MNIKLFEEKIKEEEGQLFGIRLFMLGIRKMWGENKNIIIMNETSFKNIINRGEHYITQAKQLLKERKGDASIFIDKPKQA